MILRLSCIKWVTRMSKVLISIKPEYVDRIMTGTKKYEYRRNLAKKKVSALIIYSTWPIMEIVGEVEVLDTLEMAPSSLWEKTKQDAGICRRKYREYFRGRKKAYAYVLGEVRRYECEKKLSDIGIFQAPQSFIYLTKEQYQLLIKQKGE